MLRTLGNAVLTWKAKPVTDYEDAAKVAEELSRVRQEHNGAGIAAPQIGMSLRIINIVYRGREYTIINPYIRHKKGLVYSLEGCLSVPDYLYEVERPEKLTLFGVDLHGRDIKLKCEMGEACVAAHEVDHLNGILITKGKKAGIKEPEEPDKLAWNE